MSVASKGNLTVNFHCTMPLAVKSAIPIPTHTASTATVPRCWDITQPHTHLVCEKLYAGLVGVDDIEDAAVVRQMMARVGGSREPLVEQLLLTGAVSRRCLHALHLETMARPRRHAHVVTPMPNVRVHVHGCNQHAYAVCYTQAHTLQIQPA